MGIAETVESCLETARLEYRETHPETPLRIMASDHRAPLNLGTDHLVTINELVDITAAIAGKRIRRRHLLDRPQGVRGRNSDNRRLREALGWEPSTPLEEGLAVTYRWIEGEIDARRASLAARKRSEPLRPSPPTGLAHTP